VVRVRDQRRGRVAVGSPDPGVTAVSGMAAVSELRHLLGVVTALSLVEALSVVPDPRSARGFATVCSRCC